MDNPWDGGGGYAPEEVANFTLDQVWSRLCDKDILSKEVGTRTRRMQGLEAVANISDKDGNMKARSAQGDEILLKPSGESKASMLRKGTYEGWVINANTGQREWITPKSKRRKD